MPPKIIKLGRRDDVSSVIKQIKAIKDREVIFELEKGSLLLQSAEGMKLIKKTGEVLGKTVKIETTDETGRLMAQKVGMLNEGSETKNTRLPSRVARSDIRPRFSDIMVPRNKIARQVAAAPVPVVKKSIASPKYETYVAPVSKSQSSRLEIELDKSSSKFSKIFILCLIVIVGVVFGLAVLLPNADITVFARSEPITRDFELTVDRSAVTVDPNSLQVPGIPISKSVSQTKSFDTTGTKVTGAKATGVVTIYNFTANILKLKASTTDLVVAGKKFVLVNDVGGIKPDGAPTTGIQIIAADGGEAYNLPANTKFQIVNSALGNQNVYAMNPAALAGGTTGTATKVLSQADLDNAASSLIGDVTTQIESDLSAEGGGKVRVVDSGVVKDILAKTANKNVGDVTDTFDMTLIAKVTGLGFKEDDVTSIIISKINQVLSSDKYLISGVAPQYAANFKSIDQALGKGLLDVHFQTIAAYKVDTGNISKILAGKNESEIKEILLSKPEIDNVQVKFWPSWFVHKAPRFNGKINITTVLSQN